MAAVMAHKGHTVIGLDVNSSFVNAVNEGRGPVKEPGLDQMIRENRTRLSATTDYEEAIAGSEATFIIVPTPSGPDGGFSLRYVLAVAESIGSALRRKRDYHLVVLASTVMPGSVDRELKPALERASGKKCGQEFGLCYNPEFIALGSVIHDLLNPDMILIGESDRRAGEILERYYQGMCDSKPRINRMNFVNAELTKLSVNTFVTTKISYANMLAQVCETLPGADADVVTAAIGCDTRIGRKYLKGALGYGGPCFPRDNKAFAALARANGTPALLAEATDELNRNQVPRLSELILANLKTGGTVGILGLSYKPDTEVIEEAQGMGLAKHLLAAGVRLIVHDPAAMENARTQLAERVTFARSARDCVQQADVLVITTPWPEYRKISPADFKSSSGKPTVLDCWRMLPRQEFERVANYLTLGLGPRASWQPAESEEEVEEKFMARAEGD